MWNVLGFHSTGYFTTYQWVLWWRKNLTVAKSSYLNMKVLLFVKPSLLKPLLTSVLTNSVWTRTGASECCEGATNYRTLFDVVPWNSLGTLLCLQIYPQFQTQFVSYWRKAEHCGGEPEQVPGNANTLVGHKNHSFVLWSNHVCKHFSQTQESRFVSYHTKFTRSHLSCQQGYWGNLHT